LSKDRKIVEPEVVLLEVLNVHGLAPPQDA
jgi:hypothetical protein